MCKCYIVTLLSLKKKMTVRAPKVVKLSKPLIIIIIIIIIIIKFFIKSSLRKQTCSNLPGKKMNKEKRKNT